MQTFYTQTNSKHDYSTTNASKRYKKKRFRFAVLSALLLSSFMFGAYMDVFANSNHSLENTSTTQVVTIEEQFATIDVEQGDTLWKIASDHAPEGIDVRDYIHQIKNENNLVDHRIQIGQLLRLP
jgi:LysM repeat protein